VPLYFRFAHKYAYITALHKDILDKDKLLAPAKVLPAGEIGDLSLTVNIDRIPDNIKELGLSGLDNQLAGAKEKLPKQGSETEQKFREAMIDEFGVSIKSLFTNGGATTLRLDVDRKTADLSLSMSVTGKPDSPLATTIKNLGQTKSSTASLIGSNSAMHGVLTLSLPAALRAQLGPMIDEGQKKAIEKETDKSKREALSALFQALRPTLKSGELDIAADLRGPNDKGLYSAVAGIKVKDGAAIDKTFRKIVADLPAEERKAVKFDVEKVGAVGIHRVTPDKNDKNTKDTFGDNPVYFAVREDAFLVGLGDKAVGESRERVRAAFAGLGLALPAKRIIGNLSPADLPKVGSHYDLPIALGLMTAIGAIPHDALAGFTVLGELGLDGSIAPVAGVLPAAIGANARGEGLMCPATCGPEAACCTKRR